jgi:hypothetical protein
MPHLLSRNPPGRDYWPKPWADGLLLTVMIATCLAIAWLRLTGIQFLIAGTSMAILIWLAWMALGPALEEER